MRNSYCELIKFEYEFLFYYISSFFKSYFIYYIILLYYLILLYYYLSVFALANITRNFILLNFLRFVHNFERLSFSKILFLRTSTCNFIRHKCNIFKDNNLISLSNDIASNKRTSLPLITVYYKDIFASP